MPQRKPFVVIGIIVFDFELFMGELPMLMVSSQQNSPRVNIRLAIPMAKIAGYLRNLK